MADQSYCNGFECSNSSSCVLTRSKKGRTAASFVWIISQKIIYSHLRKCTSLLFVQKLRRLSTPVEFIRKFTEACVLPLILYCSSAIFPVCLSFNYLTNHVSERHMKASSNFAVRIRGEHQHPPNTRTYQT